MNNKDPYTTWDRLKVPSPPRDDEDYPKLPTWFVIMTMGAWGLGLAIIVFLGYIIFRVVAHYT